jgi:predicted ATPase
VEEAATDLIAVEQVRGNAEPWKDASFIDSVANLQKLRFRRASQHSDAIQFHDRSLVCTVALARYLGHALSNTFSRDLESVISMYERRVFFVRNLGFIMPTEARRISFEETLRFEQIHEQTYLDYGFEILFIEPGNVSDRAAAIKASLGTP